MTAELTIAAKMRAVVQRFDALAATAELASVNSASFGSGRWLQGEGGPSDATFTWKNRSVWPAPLRAEFMRVLAQAESDVFLEGSEPSPLPQILAETSHRPHHFSGFLRYLPDETKRAEATFLHRATQYFATKGEFEDKEAIATLAKSWARLVLDVRGMDLVPFLSEVFEGASWRDPDAEEGEPPRGFFESPAGCEIFRSTCEQLQREHKLQLVHYNGFFELMERYYAAVRETVSRDAPP